MASTPQYASTPKCSMAQITTANTNLDGTGTIVTVFTAGASGSRLDRVVLKAAATTASGMVRLFIHDGTTARLLTEVPVAPATASSTTTSFEQDISFDGGISLQAGYSLRASTAVASTINVIALGGDF